MVGARAASARPRWRVRARARLRGRPGLHPTMRASTRRLPSWWYHGSLRADRILKARLYARAGIEDYWIVNLVDRVLEVHRAPTGPRSGRRAAYGEVRRIAPSEFAAPLAAPSATIAVADLLP